MNVSISSPVFDINGHARIMNALPGGMSDFSLRVSRVATLDGGAAINNFGYSDADLTMDIRWPATDEAIVESVRRMAKIYSRLIIATAEGCFVGAPASFSLSDGEAGIQILIEKRLNQ